MNETVVDPEKWSINEALNCKIKLGILKGFIDDHKTMFKFDDIIRNLKIAFNLNSGHMAKTTYNFPNNTILNILKKYNINNNYFDFSCGWGSRLLGSMYSKVNYYGTDPNYKLTKKLNKLIKDYKEVNKIKTEAKIYTQGSEVFILELENKIGLAFSSPPYFLLEDYKYGEQSYKEGTTYQEWLENYWRNAVKNIKNILLKMVYS